MAKTTIIHVNRQHIAMNSKDGGHRPVYTAKQGGKTIYAQGVEIEGRVRLIDPRVTPPLPCGARAWIEVVDGDVSFIEPCSFAESRAT
jgi:hypothetical protein